MMNLRDAAQQALEALEINNQAWKHLADSGDAGFFEAEEQSFYELSIKAITALRAALEQPTHDEPMAWYCNEGRSRGVSLKQESPEWTPLYTAPTQRKPLSDDEISSLWDGHVVPVFGKNGINPIVFARAIEKAHGIGDINGS